MGEIKIEQNKNRFLELLKSIERPGMDKFINWLETKSDFFTAPASTCFHGNYEGALVEHSINVYELFKQKNEIYKLGLSDDSVKIMALLHDICKANYYKPSTRNRKIDGTWKAIPWYDVEDGFPLGHGEKSVIMLQQFIRLSAEEMMGIRWHMGNYDVSDTGSKAIYSAWDKFKSGVCLHTADLEASNLLEEHIDYEHPQQKFNI